MTAADVIREMEAVGIHLTVHGDRLLYRARPDVLTAEVMQTLRENKAELLSLITARDHLLSVARELGLPDKIVLDLPASELAATAEQSTWYADAEVQHKLLVFYLRSLAGIEPALPGSLAARDQARHIP
jgi:hypothetical protein